MRRRIIALVVSLVVIVGVVGVFVRNANAQAEKQVVNIPPTWGVFKGTRGSDLVFEDQTKTIHIIELFEYGDSNGQLVLRPVERIRITRNPN